MGQYIDVLDTNEPKYILLHSINESLWRQRVRSHGRYEIVSPCKEINKESTLKPANTPNNQKQQQKLITQPMVTRNLEKDLTTHTTKNDYTPMKTWSNLQKQ